MLTQEQIQFLNDTCLTKWTEKNGIIDVDGSFRMEDTILTKIPVKFGYVKGDVLCIYNKNLTTLLGFPTKVDGSCYLDRNKLTSLEGSPFIVGGSFSCDSNLLTSLEGGPKEVGRSYSCLNNLLTNLIGAPKKCNVVFNCINNNLTSLEGCPEYIKDSLGCSNNQLTSLEGCPSVINGSFEFTGNPLLYILYGMPKVGGKVLYDNHNSLNEWIINQAKKGVSVTYLDIARWIKHNDEYQLVQHAPKEVQQFFAPEYRSSDNINLHESKNILNFKNFKNTRK